MKILHALRRLFRRSRPVRRSKPCSLRLGLESFEQRVLPSVTAAVLTIREATSAGPEAAAQAGIQATVDAYRADLGGVNNGNTLGSQGTGRREITWDGADNDAAPARLPADFFNAVAPRGAIFTGDPRLQFQVSADATPAVPGTALEFGQLNATYPTAFAAFSSPRLFTALNNNVYDVEFFVPGSLERATVSGFGAVFTDVDVSGSTKLEFFDKSGQEIFERTVLATSGDESLSFLGVTFAGSPVAMVRITSGSAVLGANDFTQGGSDDIVVVDNFIYGEPQPLSDPRIVVGSDTGGPIRVVNGATNATLAEFTPFPNVQAEVRVAQGDITGDGVDDIITALGAGSTPHVKVFDGVTFAELHSFYAFLPDFRGGISIGVGNINGDQFMDIVVGAGPGGGPNIRVLNGNLLNNLDANGLISSSANLANFYAFLPDFRGGVHVSTGDTNGDFLDDVIVGTATGTSHVKSIDATQLTNLRADDVIAAAAELRTFIAFPGFTGGIFVAGGDVSGDGRSDIVIGTGPGASHVKAFSGVDNAEFLSFFAYGGGSTGGVRVSTANIDDERRISNILTTPGDGNSGLVQFYGVPLTQLDQFFAFDPLVTQGAFVAGSR